MTSPEVSRLVWGNACYIKSFQRVLERKKFNFYFWNIPNSIKPMVGDEEKILTYTMLEFSSHMWNSVSFLLATGTWSEVKDFIRYTNKHMRGPYRTQHHNPAKIIYFFFRGVKVDSRNYFSIIRLVYKNISDTIYNRSTYLKKLAKIR